MEETGLAARSIHRLGDNSPCTGRLNNRIHAFFVETGERIAEPEPGIAVETVTARELVHMIKAGEFVSQLHIGSLMLAQLYGFIDLPRRKPRSSRKREPRSRTLMLRSAAEPRVSKHGRKFGTLRHPSRRPFGPPQDED